MLRRSVGEGRVSHAQLFTGDSGRGTLPLALAYVQYINCTDRHDGDSCGRCPSCIKMAELVHPDVHFVFPTNTSRSGSQKPMSDAFLPQWREAVLTSGGYFDEQMWYGRIGLDNQQGLIAKREADEIIRKLSFKAFEAEYKAVVIWLPEKMGVEASNGLLKILEERGTKRFSCWSRWPRKCSCPPSSPVFRRSGCLPSERTTWNGGWPVRTAWRRRRPPRWPGLPEAIWWSCGRCGASGREASGEDFDNFASSCVSVTTTGTWSCWDGPRIWRRWGAKPETFFQVCSFPVAGKLHAFGRNGKYILSLGTGKGVLRKVRPFRRQRQYRAVGGGEPYRPAAYKPERQCEDSLHALRSVG